MKQLPEYVKFKADMEKAGEVVAIYDDGTPFVHAVDHNRISRLTSVRTDHFTEPFDRSTKCVYPIPEDGKNQSVLATL